MAYIGNKVYNIFINSKNRQATDKAYDFTILFDSDEIVVNGNEGVNVNVVSFSLLNSMYNVNEYTENNKFKVRSHVGHHHTDTTYTIPYGNYNVYSLRDQLNLLLEGIISVSYNIATNTYTFKNLTDDDYSIMPMNAYKLLGLPDTTAITPEGVVSGYVNMVNYQQIILRCPSLVFESYALDNIRDKNNFMGVSDFLYWVNKQDVEPFKMINYKNEDCSTVYSYNVLNKTFNALNFKLVNEFNEPILDAPDLLLQLQISIYDKDNYFFKEGILKGIGLLNDIYFTLLNLFNYIVKNKMSSVI